ncbi:hypothetical protein POX_c03778 [Penicillium oxalicum]|uniref:hypothetical protein n=1 Tax=Penicillium oxalicum TaxID=69781 RepID=UPI0020B82C6E|nr:hypothetical protein POX_c03778 [Penicillium oxalicum]KAI2790926.1 hypothetical protein POX_c03778 [Penicillium oxalicum]
MITGQKSNYSKPRLTKTTKAFSVFCAEDMCFGPSLVSLLPKFPTGDWNDGLVAKDTKDGRPHFAYERVFMRPNVHCSTILSSPNSLVSPGRSDTLRMKPQHINGYQAIISGPNSLAT